MSPIAALMLAALVPAACVLWFMSVAMSNERLAVGQRMAEVYSNQLASLQRQAHAFWKERQAALAAAAGESAAEKFAAIVRGGLADCVVVYDSAGKPLYPGPTALPAPVEERGEWATAREAEFQKKDYATAIAAYARIAEASHDIHTKAGALLAEAGARLKAGDKPAAIVRLSQVAGDASLRNAISAQGTLIAPNAQLLLVKLLGGGPALEPAQSQVERAEPSRDERGTRHGMPAPRRARGPELVERASGSPTNELAHRTLDALVGRLNDYTDRRLSASQRRFLMHEVIGLLGNAAEAPRSQDIFPTFAAEDLAAEYLEAHPPPAAGARLQRTAAPKVWQLPSVDRTVVALYCEDRVKADVAELPGGAALPDVRVQLLSPGEPFAASKLVPPLDAGDFLPGWRLALVFKGADPLAEASARQMRFYLWSGFFVVVIIAVLAFLVARYVNAQMRLARLKNELVSTVSHELKTPLASMRALVDTLSSGRYQDEKQLHDYLQLISRENERLSHLIENFLTFSRLERGKAQFQREPVAPKTIISGAASALREKLNAGGCRFTVEIAPDLPEVRGDADALTTVLVNLLDNACKYTDGARHIRARACADAGFVCFEVADNGIGLAPAETKQIFERFYQVDQSLTRQRGGCGLGLSIVQSIVRAHGGTVEVESALGQGSVFRVKIPVETLNIQRSTLK